MKVLLGVFLFFLSFPIRSEKLNFRPLLANPFEGRIGTFYQISNDKLRLDIGSSFDWITLKTNDSFRVVVGSDFFTLTRLRSQSNFKFPVETIDYFFGANFSALNIFRWGTINSRIRIAHISAHIVDGLAKDSILLRLPYIYSREFVEVITALIFNNLRIYGGGEFIFSTLPKDVNKINFEFGFDFEENLLRWVDFLIGVDLKLNGYNNQYHITSNIKSGFSFTLSEYKGLFIGFYYMNGKNIQGMYYKEDDKYFGIGFEFLIY